MDNYYTGIGSRNAPEWALAVANDLGYMLALRGYVLRSGGADGMDTEFEKGCDNGKGKKEIYLPWKEFNGNKSKLYKIDKIGMKIAENFHPNWKYLKPAVKKLHTRNVYQITGYDWKHYSKFVICYTPWNKGGTLQTLRIANEYNIPIYNLIDYQNKENITSSILNKIKKNKKIKIKSK